MKHIFYAGCPKCEKEFPVNWELRHAGMNLVCPFCFNKFLPDDARKLDERQA